jgi:hypothetical protein
MVSGTILIPVPSPLFFGKSLKYSREGDAFPIFRHTYKQYKSSNTKLNLGEFTGSSMGDLLDRKAI